jgi:predicted anti-sigma-YlaC factor YlaD
MKLEEEKLKKMIGAIFHTHANEIDCEKCYHQLDSFAEMVLTGQQLDNALSLIKEHLEKCADCREEFELLLKALQILQV